jgi:hypothetical protein
MTRKKLILILISLAFLDMIIPIPFFGIFLIYLVVKRPVRFLDYVREVYAQK